MQPPHSIVMAGHGGGDGRVNVNPIGVLQAFAKLKRWFADKPISMTELGKAAEKGKQLEKRVLEAEKCGPFHWPQTLVQKCETICADNQ